MGPLGGDRVAGPRLGGDRVVGRRRALAGACAAGSVALLLPSVAGGGDHGPGVTVVAAARDLPAGRPLSGRDLVELRLPAGAVPDGVLRRVDKVVGRAPAAAVRRGEALTDVRLRRPGPSGALTAGLVAAPVRMADAAAVALLRPGERIDVLAADVEPPGEVRSVASGLEVIEVPRTGIADEGALLMLAATPEQARALARESAIARLSFTVQRP